MIGINKDIGDYIDEGAGFPGKTGKDIFNRKRAIPTMRYRSIFFISPGCKNSETILFF